MVASAVQRTTGLEVGQCRTRKFLGLHSVLSCWDAGADWLRAGRDCLVAVCPPNHRATPSGRLSRLRRQQPRRKSSRPRPLTKASRKRQAPVGVVNATTPPQKNLSTHCLSSKSDGTQILIALSRQLSHAFRTQLVAASIESIASPSGITKDIGLNRGWWSSTQPRDSRRGWTTCVLMLPGRRTSIDILINTRHSIRIPNTHRRQHHGRHGGQQQRRRRRRPARQSP